MQLNRELIVDIKRKKHCITDVEHLYFRLLTINVSQKAKQHIYIQKELATPLYRKITTCFAYPNLRRNGI